MNESDLLVLKGSINQVVEIETWKGERILMNVTSVFDRESDPDAFYFDVTSDPLQRNFAKIQGVSLPLVEIKTVRKYVETGGRA